MPVSKKSYYRRRYVSRYTRRWRRSFRRYYRPYKPLANGSSRSSVRLRIHRSYVGSLYIDPGEYRSYVGGVNPFIQQSNANSGYKEENIFIAGAVNERLYFIYQTLYDQVKCDGMKVHLTITSPIGPSTGLNSLKIRTAWVRRCDQSDYKSEYNQSYNIGWPNSDALVGYANHHNYIGINNSVPKINESY